MSREQWGNGYHRGVQDAQKKFVEGLDGWQRPEIELIMEYCIAKMYYRRYVLTGQDFHRDISCYPVEWFYSDFGYGDKIPKQILDIIYEYILSYRPYNTQITGPDGGKDIKNDEIRVYGYLPDDFKSYEEWEQDVCQRMTPIFQKIENVWWEQYGL